MSSFNMFCFECTACVLIYISLVVATPQVIQGRIERHTFVMLVVVYEQLALMSSSYSETRLLLYANEQLAMSH